MSPICKNVYNKYYTVRADVAAKSFSESTRGVFAAPGTRDGVRTFICTGSAGMAGNDVRALSTGPAVPAADVAVVSG